MPYHMFLFLHPASSSVPSLRLLQYWLWSRRPACDAVALGGCDGGQVTLAVCPDSSPVNSYGIGVLLASWVLVLAPHFLLCLVSAGPH